MLDIYKPTCSHTPLPLRCVCSGGGAEAVFLTLYVCLSRRVRPVCLTCVLSTSSISKRKIESRILIFVFCFADLSHNKISDSGARAVGKLLNGRSNLTTLNLCDNKIRSNGAAAIGHALGKNTTLMSINLRLNRWVCSFPMLLTGKKPTALHWQFIPGYAGYPSGRVKNLKHNRTSWGGFGEKRKKKQNRRHWGRRSRFVSWSSKMQKWLGANSAIFWPPCVLLAV